MTIVFTLEVLAESGTGDLPDSHFSPEHLHRAGSNGNVIST